jgi:hypothetical protein
LPIQPQCVTEATSSRFGDVDKYESLLEADHDDGLLSSSIVYWHALLNPRKKDSETIFNSILKSRCDLLNN